MYTLTLVCCVLLVGSVLTTPTDRLSRLVLDNLKSNSDGNAQSRIIDGDLASERAAPYIVSISLSSLAYGHNCAGTIIAKEWVLTAAHCVQELNELNGNIVGLPVYAGMQDRSQHESAQIRTIDWAFKHKQFNGNEGTPDIALLHVTPQFEFNSLVRPITLPSISEEFSGISTSFGWGLNDSEAVKYVTDLQVGRAEVLNRESCSNLLPEESPIGKNEICASVTACFGDGGSPLVMDSGDGFAQLIGITSWGYLPCGYNKRPTVYTAVSQYIDWIAEVQWAYYILN